MHVHICICRYTHTHTYTHTYIHTSNTQVNTAWDSSLAVPASSDGFPLNAQHYAVVVQYKARLHADKVTRASQTKGTHAHARTRTHTYAHARTRTHTHAHARTRTHTHAVHRMSVYIARCCVWCGDGGAVRRASITSSCALRGSRRG